MRFAAPFTSNNVKGVISMEKTVTMEVARVHRLESDSKIKAFVDIAIGDYLVKGLRVVQGAKGLFVGLPQEKSKDGKWYNTFAPLTDEAKEELSALVLEKYQE